LRRPFSHAVAKLSDRLDAQKAQIVSDRVLSCSGWPDVAFAFHDREEIGIFTEGNEGNKGWSWIWNPSLSSLSFVYVFSCLAVHRREFLQKATKKTKVGLGFGTLRYLRFLLFNFPSLAPPMASAFI
jgi:hypothetical protein